MPKIKFYYRFLYALSFALLLLASLPSLAEQKVTQKNYQVHYSVFPSNAISAEVAAVYQIKRSKNRALINITPQKNIRKNTEEAQKNISDDLVDSTIGIKALVSGKARNLIGNTKQLEFREVIEGDVIYYLAEFRYSHEEHFRFDIQVQPLEKKTDTINLKFEKKFRNK